MYNGNADAVNAIIRRKTQMGLMREHPDMPGDESMRLYHVPWYLHRLYAHKIVNLYVVY